MSRPEPDAPAVSAGAEEEGMDASDLADMLSGSIMGEPQSFSISRPHPRFAMYKYKQKVEECQEKRRTANLKRQAERRAELVASFRSLHCDWEADDQMDIVEHKNVNPRIGKVEAAFADKLMMGEWLVDVPEDIEINWLMVPCPKGKRCMLVCQRNKVFVYTRRGRKIRQFYCDIPSGTVLDCIFDMETGIFYVLDLISWKDQLMVENDTDCRFYIMQSRMEEIISSRKKRESRFRVLPNYVCNRDTMQTAIDSHLSSGFEFDGLLFYHRQAKYEAGETPLVGWLKPFMMTEMFGITLTKDVGKRDEQLVRDFEEAAKKKQEMK